METYIIVVAAVLGVQYSEFQRSSQPLPVATMIMAVLLLVSLADTGHGYSIQGLLLVVYASMFGGWLVRMITPSGTSWSSPLGLVALAIYLMLTVHLMASIDGEVSIVVAALKMAIPSTIAVVLVAVVGRINPSIIQKKTLVLGMLVLFLTLLIQLVPFFWSLFGQLGSDRLGVKSSVLWGALVCSVLACVSGSAGTKVRPWIRLGFIPFLVVCGLVSLCVNFAWSVMFSFQTTSSSLPPISSYAMLDHSYWVHACVTLAVAGFVVGSLSAATSR